MESARVRGCVATAPTGAGRPRGDRSRRPERQADASRRRNGPRNRVATPGITVRLSGKTCPAPVTRCDRTRERASSGNKPRPPQQAVVGKKTRSAGRTPPASLHGASAALSSVDGPLRLEAASLLRLAAARVERRRWSPPAGWLVSDAALSSVDGPLRLKAASLLRLAAPRVERRRWSPPAGWRCRALSSSVDGPLRLKAASLLRLAAPRVERRRWSPPAVVGRSPARSCGGGVN
jgi:hypothetical protein